MNKAIYFFGGLIIGVFAGAYAMKYYLDNQNDVEYINDKEEIKNKPTNVTPIHPVDPAQNEHPQDSDEDEGFEDFMGDVNERIENKKRPLEVITAEQLDNVPIGFSEVIVRYYTNSAVFVEDEDGSIIENEDLFFGDALTNENFFNDTVIQSVFVINYNLNAVYEIRKYNGTYGEDF